MMTTIPLTGMQYLSIIGKNRPYPLNCMWYDKNKESGSFWWSLFHREAMPVWPPPSTSADP